MSELYKKLLAVVVTLFKFSLLAPPPLGFI